MTARSDTELTVPTAGSKALRAAIPVAILIIGIVGFVVLVKTKEEPKKKPRVDRGVLVETITAEEADHTIVLKVHGTVMPAQKVVLSPEVPGRVNWINPKLTPGSRFQKGDKLVRINSREYVLAARQQRAAVDRAQTELEIERGRKKVAEREWQLVGDGDPVDGGLALREPQIRTAEVALKAAKSGLHRSQLNISRTLIRAPFNGTVQAKQVDIGQMVSSASPLVTLVGSDAYWVQVSVPIDRLDRISIPGIGGTTEGTKARLRRKMGKQTVTRVGRVIRLLSDLDPVGRMARILVQIDDPLGLQADKGATPTPTASLPLLIGDYVEVDLEGKGVEAGIEIPRVALRDGDSVFIMTEDDKLEIRNVSVVWREREIALIDSGIRAGDQIIVSPIAAPVKGMRLRVMDGKTTKGASSGASTAAEAPAQPTQKAPE